MDNIMEQQQTQKPGIITNPDHHPPLPHHERLPVLLKLLRDQAHERRLSAVPLAARLLRECGGGDGGAGGSSNSNSKAQRERAQITAHEALRHAITNSGGGGGNCGLPVHRHPSAEATPDLRDIGCLHRWGEVSSSSPRIPSAEEKPHPQDPPFTIPKRGSTGININRGAGVEKASDRKGSPWNSPDLEEENGGPGFYGGGGEGEQGAGAARRQEELGFSKGDNAVCFSAVDWQRPRSKPESRRRRRRRREDLLSATFRATE